MKRIRQSKIICFHSFLFTNHFREFPSEKLDGIGDHSKLLIKNSTAICFFDKIPFPPIAIGVSNFQHFIRLKYNRQFPSAIGWRKKVSAIIKTIIWVSHEYYLNPEFHKILWRAFWVIAILRFSPYGARVDFKGLISE